MVNALIVKRRKSWKKKKNPKKNLKEKFKMQKKVIIKF